MKSYIELEDILAFTGIGLIILVIAAFPIYLILTAYSELDITELDKAVSFEMKKQICNVQSKDIDTGKFSVYRTFENVNNSLYETSLVTGERRWNPCDETYQLGKTGNNSNYIDFIKWHRH